MGSSATPQGIMEMPTTPILIRQLRHDKSRPKNGRSTPDDFIPTVTIEVSPSPGGTQARPIYPKVFSYEKAETELVKWRQAAAMRNDSLTYGKCQEFLLELVKKYALMSTVLSTLR